MKEQQIEFKEIVIDHLGSDKEFVKPPLKKSSWPTFQTSQ